MHTLYVLFILLCFIFFVLYIQFDSIPFESKISDERHYSVIPPPSTVKNPTIPTACQHVDFRWLVNDRVYWDGWVSKSMFLNTNGGFTEDDVEIEQGKTICIVALLGPIPALGEVQFVQHYAPSDAIMMTATNYEKDIEIPIRLHQHESFSHVYYAQVQFAYHGTFVLETSVEYRSYFWEYPEFHSYRPNRFISENRLIVDPKETMQAPCLTMDSFTDSAWRKERDEWRFEPRCQLLRKCTSPRRIHVWGDNLMRRNIDALIGKDSNGIEISDMRGIEEIPYEDTLVYFGYMNKTIGSDFTGWKQSIHEMVTTHSMETPDVVILGVGNADLYKPRQGPAEFSQGFVLFINYMMKLYSDEQTKIFIKTTSWMNGRYYGKSEAYANVVRSVVSHLDNRRVLLWDTHQFRARESSCKNRSYVTALENRILQSMFCQLPLL